MQITLDLTDREVGLLRSCVSGLPATSDCRELQLKVTGAFVDALLLNARPASKYKVGERVRVSCNSLGGTLTGFVGTVYSFAPLVIVDEYGKTHSVLEKDVSPV